MWPSEVIGARKVNEASDSCEAIEMRSVMYLKY